MAESYQNVNKTIVFILKFFQIFLYLFGIIRLQETFEQKKIKAGRSAGTPQSGYTQAQLARFGFRVSKHILFCLIWD
jgi:hypothetical protein